MNKLKSTIVLTLLGLGLLTSVAWAAILNGYQGGTGIGSTASSNVGKVLTVSSTTPWLTWTLGSGGGSSISFPIPVASTSLSATSPLSLNGNVLSMPTSTSGQSGYLSFSDWNTFNNKQSNYWVNSGTYLYPTSTSWNVGIGTTTALSPLFIEEDLLGATIGATSTSGINLINTTVAATGTQQMSPSITWSSNGWKTNATSSSVETNWQAYSLPVQGATAPTANWILGFTTTTGSFIPKFTLTSAGALTIPGIFTSQSSGNFSGTLNISGAFTGASTGIFSQSIGVSTSTAPTTGITVAPSLTNATNATNFISRIIPKFNGASTTLAVYNSYAVPQITLTNGTTTITSLYNYYSGLTNSTGTITNYYANYVAAPTGNGTTNDYSFVSEPNSGSFGIGTTTPSSLLTVNGDLFINTSSTLGTVISGIWKGTPIADSYIASASTWNSMTPNSTQVIAGTNLTGGGALTSNVTLNVTSTPSFTNITATASTTIGSLNGYIVGKTGVLTSATTSNSFSFSIASPSSTTDLAIVQHQLPYNAIITSIYCNTDTATTTLYFDSRSTSTPNTQGTVISSGSGLNCNSTGATTNIFSSATWTANNIFNVHVSSTVGTSNFVRGTVFYNRND